MALHSPAQPASPASVWEAKIAGEGPDELRRTPWLTRQTRHRYSRCQQSRGCAMRSTSHDRRLGSFPIKPSAPPCISSCSVSCGFSKPLLSFGALSILCNPRGVSLDDPSGRLQLGLLEDIVVRCLFVQCFEGCGRPFETVEPAGQPAPLLLGANHNVNFHDKVTSIAGSRT